MKNNLLHRKQYVHKVQYELIIAFFLIIELISKMPSPDSMQEFCTMPYAMTYKLGFAPRLLIGTILSFFTDYLTKMQLWMFICIALLLLIALVVFMLGNIIRKSSDEVRSFSIVLAMLFLASPASISYLFYVGNYGRLEIFLLIFTLLSFIALQHQKAKWLVPLFSAMAMATHQIFLFLFFPPLLIAIFYELVRKKFSLGYTVFTTVFLATSAISFFVFQYVKVLTYDDAQLMMDAIAAYTNAPLIKEFLVYEYFSSLKENFLFYWGNTRPDLFLRGIISMVMVSPLLIGFVLFWVKCIKIEKNKENEQNPFLRFVYLASMLSPLATIPVFILAIDWGRWFAALFICQFILVFYFISVRAEAAVAAAHDFIARAKPHRTNKKNSNYRFHKFSLGIFILYLAALGKFEVLDVLQIAPRMMNIARNLMQLVAAR